MRDHPHPSISSLYRRTQNVNSQTITLFLSLPNCPPLPSSPLLCNSSCLLHSWLCSFLAKTTPTPLLLSSLFFFFFLFTHTHIHIHRNRASVHSSFFLLCWTSAQLISLQSAWYELKKSLLHRFICFSFSHRLHCYV